MWNKKWWKTETIIIKENIQTATSPAAMEVRRWVEGERERDGGGGEETRARTHNQQREGLRPYRELDQS